jgi:hypothetical protein
MGGSLSSVAPSLPEAQNGTVRSVETTGIDQPRDRPCDPKQPEGRQRAVIWRPRLAVVGNVKHEPTARAREIS